MEKYNRIFILYKQKEIMRQYLKIFNNSEEYSSEENKPIFGHIIDEAKLEHYVDPTLLYLRYDSANDRYVAVDYQGKLLLDYSDGYMDQNKILYKLHNEYGGGYSWIATRRTDLIEYYTDLWGVSELDFECVSLDSETYDGYNSWWDSSWTLCGREYWAGIYVDSSVETRIVVYEGGNRSPYNPPMYKG